MFGEFLWPRPRYGAAQHTEASERSLNALSSMLPSEWTDRIRAAEKSGDLVIAFDLANQALVEHPADTQLRYLATRALARSGAPDRAAKLYREYGLDQSDDTDIAALGARIMKDAALSFGRPRKLLIQAADAYARVFHARPGHYPAVNAATLYCLAGRTRLAREYALQALSPPTSGPTEQPLDRYYRYASSAEASLVLNDDESAARFISEAAKHIGRDFDAAATTCRQLQLLLQATGRSGDILDPIRPPSVLHYSAPILTALTARMTARSRADITALVNNCCERNRLGFAYGSLNPGGEIIAAWACLDAGIELNVVLPFPKEQFVDSVVARAGQYWLARFDACLSRASTIRVATNEPYLGEDALFTYARRFSMGLAILHGRSLQTRVLHVEITNRGWQPDALGHRANLRLWQRNTLPVERMDATPSTREEVPVKRPPRQRSPRRVARALLFGDVKGFSQTPPQLIPAFQRLLMGAIAGALNSHDPHVQYRNSWGDAVYAVIDDPIVAARCCLDIQMAIRKAPLARYGLSPTLALRLAAHYGPVYMGHDHIRDERTFFGAQTIVAARMEPVTAPGEVYLTESMAAAIAFAGSSDLRTEYVGNWPLAKGYGNARMYALTKADILPDH